MLGDAMEIVCGYCRTCAIGASALILTMGGAAWGADASAVAMPAQTIAGGIEETLCEGDCDGGTSVGISELLTLVNVALQRAQPSACANGVALDSQVNVAFLVRAVYNALRGCPAEVSLTGGVVRGSLDGQSRRFLGIPYAAPPTGDLRWRPPQPPASWSGVRRANDFASSCTLISGGRQRFSVDCLYLNVWAPHPAPASPSPVMVWFHGGGNHFLSASATFSSGGLQYNGRTLAETRDVIVVTVNYRLGVFGFFSHPDLVAEDPNYPYAGNQGLLDQRAALEWVRDNIAAFGGDPDNVTIFGESWGGLDVCLHMVSPGSAGLFHRAISQSNGCTTHLREVGAAAPAVQELVSSQGCAASPDVLTCLRQVPASTLANRYAFAWPGVESHIDGGFLADQPRTLFDSGAFSKVPYLLGANADEGNEQLDSVAELIQAGGGYLGALQNLFGDRAGEVAALYPPEDFPASELGSSEVLALARVIGDRDNVCPTYDTARRAAAGGSDVYLYNFARPDADPRYASLGADHQAEIGYVFGSIELQDESDRLVAEAMQGYWTRLARDGDPNGEGALEWPVYEDASDERIHLDEPISVVAGFRRARCAFWWDRYDEEFE